MTDAEAIWAAKSDEELLEAAGEVSGFTEEGERIIRAELKRRGLPTPAPPIGRCVRCGRAIGADASGDQCSQCGEPFPSDVLRDLGRDAPDIELVQVLRTGDSGLILLAKSLLDAEGIDHIVRGDSIQDLFGVGRLGSGYNYITGPAEFWVKADDAERARAVLDELSAAPRPDAESDDDTHE